MSQNPIYPGFAWDQAFDFPEGWLEAGDQIRAEVRATPLTDALLAAIGMGAGIVIDGRRVFMTLSKQQTATIDPDIVDSVVTNFVLVRGGREIPIGQIVKIPVAGLPTRALA